MTITSGGGRAYVFVLQPSYLWFLWYLVILYAIALVLSPAGPAATRRVEAIASHPLGRWAGLAGLILCTAALLWPHSEWFAPPPAHFDPDPYVLGYYGLFFCLGAFLADPGRLRALATPKAWRWLAAAVILVIPAGILYAMRNRGGVPPGDAVHAAALLTLAATTWTSLFALIGLAGRYLPERRPALRYVADSSYWIYLIHLQVMVCLIAAMKPLGLPTAPFFVILVALTSAISFALYPYLVRYTIIGRVLHGPRHRPQPNSPALTPRAAAASPPA